MDSDNELIRKLMKDNATIIVPATDKQIAPAPNPFDPSAYALPQDYLDDGATEELLTSVEVRKPKSTEFVRVHPSEEYCRSVAVLELNDVTYLVSPSLLKSLDSDVALVRLFTATNRQGAAFLWKVKLPRPGYPPMGWHASALAAARAAKDHWIRVRADRDQARYKVDRAMGNLGEPNFPSVGFDELMRLAFADRVIDNPEHEAVQRLWGAT